MASIVRERLDEIFGYLGEETRKLVESLKFCFKGDPRMPDDCDLLTIEPNSSSGTNYFLYLDGCAVHAEYDKGKEHIMIKIGGKPENRRRAKITLDKMAGAKTE